MGSEVFKRIPFICVDWNDRLSSNNGSLIFNHTTNELYVKDLNGNIKKVSEETINDLILLVEDELLEGVSPDGDTLNKISLKIISLFNWVNDNSSITGMDIDNINKLIISLKNIISLEGEIENLTDIDPTRILSTNDFTNYLKNKLDSIDSDANYYIHPLDKQCTYESSLKSVNGKTGNVTITKEELGLGSVEEGANYYEHSEYKECGPGVDRVYSKTGDVVTKKRYVDLPLVENYKPATLPDIEAGVGDKYLTNKNINQYVKDLIDETMIGSTINGYTVYFDVDPPTSIVRMLINGSWVIGPMFEGVFPGIYTYEAYHPDIPTAYKSGRVIVKDSNVTIELFLIRYKLSIFTLPENAEVRFYIEDDYYTDRSYNLFPGVYELEVRDPNGIYTNRRKTVVMPRYDRNIYIYLVPRYTVKFNINVENAIIIFDGIKYFDDDVILVPEKLYEYTIIKDNHITIKDSIYVNSNMEIPIDLIYTPKITFNIIPKPTEFELSDFISEDENMFRVIPNESYTYTAKRFGYGDLSEVVDIGIEDVVVTKHMENRSSLLIQPNVEGCIIKIKDNNVWVEIDRIYTVEGDTYEYTVEKDGYYKIESSIVATDRLLLIRPHIHKKITITLNIIPSITTGLTITLNGVVKSGLVHEVESERIYSLFIVADGFLHYMDNIIVELDDITVDVNLKQIPLGVYRKTIALDTLRNKIYFIKDNFQLYEKDFEFKKYKFFTHSGGIDQHDSWIDFGNLAIDERDMNILKNNKFKLLSRGSFTMMGVTTDNKVYFIGSQRRYYNTFNQGSNTISYIKIGIRGNNGSTQNPTIMLNNNGYIIDSDGNIDTSNRFKSLELYEDHVVGVKMDGSIYVDIAGTWYDARRSEVPSGTNFLRAVFFVEACLALNSSGNIVVWGSWISTNMTNIVNTVNSRGKIKDIGVRGGTYYSTLLVLYDDNSAVTINENTNLSVINGNVLEITDRGFIIEDRDPNNGIMNHGAPGTEALTSLPFFNINSNIIDVSSTNLGVSNTGSLSFTRKPSSYQSYYIGRNNNNQRYESAINIRGELDRHVVVDSDKKLESYGYNPIIPKNRYNMATISGTSYALTEFGEVIPLYNGLFTTSPEIPDNIMYIYIHSCWNLTLGIRNNGDLYWWGEPDIIYDTPLPVKVKDASCGMNLIGMILEDGSVDIAINDKTDPIYTDKPEGSNFKQIVCSNKTCMVIDTENKVYIWGEHSGYAENVYILDKHIENI